MYGREDLSSTKTTRETQQNVFGQKDHEVKK